MLTKTITTVFMLPTLKIGRENLSSSGFINAYLLDIDKDNYPDCIHVLFKPSNIGLFREFFNEQLKRDDLVDNYDYEDGYVVLVYKLPEKFKDDFELIQQGKYSKTSTEFKNSFPKAIKILKEGLHRDELSLQWRIFKRSNDLIEYWEERMGVRIKDEEVWDIFEIEKETLDINKLKPILC